MAEMISDKRISVAEIRQLADDGKSKAPACASRKPWPSKSGIVGLSRIEKFGDQRAN
jgi:hypothetical protein